MKPVHAQFKSSWRPSRLQWAGTGVLVAGLLIALGAHQWLHLELLRKRQELAQLEDGPRPRPAPPSIPQTRANYAASAQNMLHERAARWAPMLRSLEAATVIDVTPTTVDFSASDGSARVELAYPHPDALVDYLTQINKDAPLNEPSGRWRLVQIRVEPTGLAVASIRSSW